MYINKTVRRCNLHIIFILPLVHVLFKFICNWHLLRFYFMLFHYYHYISQGTNNILTASTKGGGDGGSIPPLSVTKRLCIRYDREFYPLLAMGCSRSVRKASGCGPQTPAISKVIGLNMLVGMGVYVFFAISLTNASSFFTATNMWGKSVLTSQRLHNYSTTENI